MTGKTNQIQTPFGSGVPAVLALAAGAAGGLASLPVNPGISYTGTLYGALFTVWQNSIVSLNGYTTPLVCANYDNASANGAGLTLPYLTTLNLGTIQLLNNAISGTLASLTSLVASSLVQINTDMSVTMNSLTTLTMPLLQYVGGNMTPALAVMTSISLPALQYVGNSCSLIAGNATSLSMPALLYAGSAFGVSMNLCTSVDLSSFQYCGGNFLPNFSALTTLSLPAIVTIVGSFTITNTVMVNFSFGSTLKRVGGNVTMSNKALNQASIDGILVSLAALDGTNGTTAYSSLTVTLTGGTNATPSATGLAAKATLVGRGCTVTNN